MQLKYDTILFNLICLYAFLIPFEHILEIFFSIDTVWKPYRLTALTTFGFFVLKTFQTKKVDFSNTIGTDLFIYLLFVYGLLITAAQVFFSPFLLRHFYNDSFQIFLYLGMFFVIKNLRLNLAQILRVFWFFVIGISLNAVYLFNNFYILKNFRRQAGFMDNPNYVSIGLIMAIVFLILQSSTAKSFRNRILLFSLTSFLLLMLIIAGSRTGIFIIGILALFLFYYASIGKKILIFGGFLFLISLYITSTNSSNVIGAPLIAFKRIQKLDNTEDTRFSLWKGAYLAVQKTNFLGVGIGQFKTRFREFYLIENEETIYENVNRGAHLSLHNDYIGIIVNYGIFGLLCYLIFIAKSGLTNLVNIRNSLSLPEKIFYRGTLLMFVALLLFGLTAESFTSALFWFVLAFSTKSIQESTVAKPV